MRFQVGDIVRIIDENAFYYNAIGRISEITNNDYLVIFTAIDDVTGELCIYESCYYYDYQLKEEPLW